MLLRRVVDRRRLCCHVVLLLRQVAVVVAVDGVGWRRLTPPRGALNDNRIVRPGVGWVLVGVGSWLLKLLLLLGSCVAVNGVEGCVVWLLLSSPRFVVGAVDLVAAALAP